MIQSRILSEFDSFAQKLQSKGVKVRVIEDTATPQKPDAIFPNNWISFHEDGTVVLYPMMAANRRLERRTDIVDIMKRDFVVRDIIDLSPGEKTNRFLEGTGSIVFDHIHQVAYACLAPRTDADLFQHLCSRLSYKPVLFKAVDAKRKPIYHTNVMMCVGEGFSVICLACISDETERSMVAESLEATGHELVEIAVEQMENFAGNMLELSSGRGSRFLVMSQRAFDSLKQEQKNSLSRHAELLPHPIPTIETLGGGSVRCMMAEVFLPEKQGGHELTG